MQFNRFSSETNMRAGTEDKAMKVFNLHDHEVLTYPLHLPSLISTMLAG